MSGEIIKSGEEIVNEFFEEILKDESLDQATREALVGLYKANNFTKGAIDKKLESIREIAIKKYDTPKKD